MSDWLVSKKKQQQQQQQPVSSKMLISSPRTLWESFPGLPWAGLESLGEAKPGRERLPELEGLCLNPFQEVAAGAKFLDESNHRITPRSGS